MHPLKSFTYHWWYAYHSLRNPAVEYITKLTLEATSISESTVYV